MEIWKEIPGFNGYYSASTLGRIKGNNRLITRSNGRVQKINEKILTPIENSKGYLKVRVCVTKGIQTNLTVHSLVALTFFGKRLKGLQINHINGIKTDNRLENLEYCSSKYNIEHAWELGLSSNDHAKKSILFGSKVYHSLNYCEKETGINRNTLASCANKGFYISKKYKVIYDGTEFNSLKEASRKIGLNPKTIAKYGKVIKPEKIEVKWITE